MHKAIFKNIFTNFTTKASSLIFRASIFLFKLNFTLITIIFFSISLFLITLSLYDGNIYLSKKSFLNKNISKLIKKYKGEENFFEFEDIAIKTKYFNIFKKDFDLDVEIDNFSYRTKLRSLDISKIDILVDFSEIFVKNFTIKSIKIDHMEYKIKKKETKKTENSIENVFIFLNNIFNSLSKETRYFEIKTFNFSIKTESFVLKNITGKQNNDNKTFAMRSDIFFDKKKSTLQVECLNKKEKTCSIDVKNISSEVLDIVLKDDRNDSKNINFHVDIEFSLDGLKNVKLKTLNQNTKISINAKNNLEFINSIEVNSLENFYLQIENLDLKHNNNQDFKIFFKVDNTVKQFDYLVVKFLNYLNLLDLIDLNHSTLKGTGSYEHQGIVNSNFYLNFKNVNLNQYRQIKGSLKAKSREIINVSLQNLYLKDFAIKDFTMDLNLKSISSKKEGSFDLVLTEDFIKNKFTKKASVNIPCGIIIQSSNNITISALSIPQEVEEISGLKVNDFKVEYENEFTNLDFTVEDNINFKLKISKDNNNNIAKGYLINGDKKFYISSSMENNGLYYFLKINDFIGFETYSIQQTPDALSIFIKSKELNGLFFKNIFDKLKSKEKSLKLIFDINIDKINLLEKRTVENFTCKGEYFNFNFSQDFICNGFFGDPDRKQYKFEIDKQKNLFFFQNIQPLLYSLGMKNIKFFSFEIEKIPEEKNKFKLNIINFEDANMKIKNSVSNIDLVDNQYLQFKDLKITFGFINFILDAKYDIYNKNIQKDIKSFNLLPE